MYICNIGIGPPEDFIPGTSDKKLDYIVDYHVGVLIHEKSIIDILNGMVTKPIEYLEYMSNIYY